jgi:ribonuclease P protein component
VEGFPRTARLLVAADFKRVFDRRPAQRGQFFTVHHRAPAGVETPDNPISAMLGDARLGIVVPKKLLKTAVHRNLVKRIVRETFRRRAGQLAGMDIIVRLSSKICRKGGPIDRQAITRDVIALFDRLPRKAGAE